LTPYPTPGDLLSTDSFIDHWGETVQMIAKILVPHDGTEMSDRAFRKAVELAKELSTTKI